MQAHQLFKAMSPALGQQIMTWMKDDEREVYKAAVTTLTQQKKVRPVFVTQRPRNQQFAWIMETLTSRLSEGVGENILQVWLMKAKSPMLANFLNTLEIRHDGKGGVEGDIPAELDSAKVAAGVTKLLAEFPAEEVGVYLNLFQMQQANGWPAITEAINANQLLGAAV